MEIKNQVDHVVPGANTQHEWATVQEVAEMLRLSERTVYRLAKSGNIPSRRFGKRTRINRNWLAVQPEIAVV